MNNSDAGNLWRTRLQAASEILAGVLLVSVLAGIVFWDRSNPTEVVASVAIAQLEPVLTEQPPPLPEIPEPPLEIMPKLPEPPLPIVAVNQEEPPAPPQLPPEPALDNTRYISLGFGFLTNRGSFTGFGTFGLALAENSKKLTYNNYGRTNNTIVRIDGVDHEFGGDHGAYLSGIDSNSKTVTGTDSIKGKGDRSVPIGEIEHSDEYSTEWRQGKVVFKQKLTHVRSKTTKLYDKMVVSYEMMNQDKVQHKVGVRIMIDTFIGDNDGVPFFVPGIPNVITRHVDLRGKEIPEYILALERNVLEDKSMTVAEFGFDEDVDQRPTRVVLTVWPPKHTQYVPRTFFTQNNEVTGSQTPWEIKPPVLGKNAKPFDEDSAALIYFDPTPIPAGESRTVKFTYGLGSLSSQGKSLASLAFRDPGPLKTGSTFWLTGIVKNPTAGQTVTLTLPDGLQLAEGELTQKVPADRSDLAYINWKVKVGEKAYGTREIAAKLTPLGVEERIKCVITTAEPWIKELVVSGEPVVGGMVRVTAQILNGQPDTKAKLELPASCSLADPAQSLEVRSALGVNASWVVRINAGKDQTFKVTLSNGPTASKTIAATTRPTEFKKLEVTGNMKSGGALRASALIAYAQPGMKVKLQLPVGITLAAGESVEKPVTSGAVPSWILAIDPDYAGPLELQATLSNGMQAKNAISVTAVTPKLTFLPATSKIVAGKKFWIVVQVYPAVKNASVDLKLPDMLKLAENQTAIKPVELKGKQGIAAWLVVPEARAAGNLEVEAKLIHDRFSNVQVKQSLTIDRGSLVE